jgi:hypothetical protein
MTFGQPTMRGRLGLAAEFGRIPGVSRGREPSCRRAIQRSRWGGRSSNPRPMDFRSAVLEHSGKYALNAAAQRF